VDTFGNLKEDCFVVPPRNDDEAIRLLNFQLILQIGRLSPHCIPPGKTEQQLFVFVQLLGYGRIINSSQSNGYANGTTVDLARKTNFVKDPIHPKSTL